MGKLSIIAVLVIISCLVSSCQPGFPAAMNQGPGEGAAPEVRQGWQDGCQSGLSVYGSDIYKTMYSFKQDPKLMTNKGYSSNWGDAFNFCRHWINTYLRQGIMGPGLSDDLRDPRAVDQGDGVMPPFLGW